MSAKQPSMLTSQVIRDGLSYILQGKLRIHNGHLPTPHHVVPTDFFGVCVASNANPETDVYVIEQLKELGLSNVKLDFSYEDIDSFHARFLQALIAEKYNITLRLLPPFEAAKHMQNLAEQTRWRTFIHAVVTQYGNQISQLEIGNTINRKRWSGYTFEGFLAAWAIAHHEIKAHGIKLIGPNIQDFEPLYNVSIFKTLQKKNQLPDAHTNNLFVERVSEPERFDHRIFKYRWATFFKFNLVKKARLLQKIGSDYGVASALSGAAFWAIYRIERLLENGALKQADYLTRYFTLLAASGALEQANWGALICHREGLINDGLQDAEYPALERIAHYKNADGELSHYVRQPSFKAMKTVAKWLSGAQYLGLIASSQGLEIHHFKQHDKQLHIAWTVNGKVAFLSDIYTKDTLKSASILDLSGDVLSKNTELITESPIYLCWETSFDIATKHVSLADNLVIHAHVDAQQYFHYKQDGWQGLILAKNAAEAAAMRQAWLPKQLQSPQKADALRHARNAIWMINDPRDPAKQLTIKQPVKMYPHKAFLDRFKPSKAKRSWNGAMELMRRGIATAKPIAYFEKVGDNTLKQNFYICEFVKADCTIGKVFSAFTAGKYPFLGLTPDIVFPQFAQFCHKMHARGIYFRDFSGGNILVNILPENQLQFTLIDTARVKSFALPAPLKLRIADLTRACHKLSWPQRVRFMQIYLALTGRSFTWQLKLPFYLYDFKVGLKRTIGRKGINKLVKHLKGQN